MHKLRIHPCYGLNSGFAVGS